jgi:hypothetical protein
MTASDVVRIMGLPDQVLLAGPDRAPRQTWIYAVSGDGQQFVVFSRGLVVRAGVSLQTMVPGVSL